jgi:hypothetical protein
MPGNSFVRDRIKITISCVSFHLYMNFSFVFLFTYLLMADGFALGLKICYFFHEAWEMECDVMVNEITQGLGFYRNHEPEGREIV